jgi:hypothetical protein
MGRVGFIGGDLRIAPEQRKPFCGGCVKKVRHIPPEILAERNLRRGHREFSNGDAQNEGETPDLFTDF